jgi:hypothetical protein
MSVAAALGVAAAVTLVLIVLVASRDGDVAPADQPSPTVTVPPTTPPRPLPPNPAGPLVPGTYFIEVFGTPTPRILLTIGDGWTGESSDGAWGIDKETSASSSSADPVPCSQTPATRAMGITRARDKPRRSRHRA